MGVLLNGKVPTRTVKKGRGKKSSTLFLKDLGISRLTMPAEISRVGTSVTGTSRNTVFGIIVTLDPTTEAEHGNWKSGKPWVN